jgi:transcriptional regulator with XRE-family HTH domain
MSLSEEIISALRERNASGDTFEHMANISGVSRAYIHQIANHRSDPLKMSLEKFLALFPSAQIELAPARVPDDPAAAAAARSDYQDLRDKYQDLRDKYQDLRDKYQDLRESVPPHVRDERSLNPYRISVPSTSSSSNK